MISRRAIRAALDAVARAKGHESAAHALARGVDVAIARGREALEAHRSRPVPVHLASVAIATADPVDVGAPLVVDAIEQPDGSLRVDLPPRR